MEKFLELISRYHFLNFLIPGVLFLFLLDKLGIYSINLNSIVDLLFGGYFSGMVLSRVGSVFIEPLFQRWKIVEYVPYWNYLKAEPKDIKISTLVSDSNMYRTIVAMLLLTIILYVCHLIPAVNVLLHSQWAILSFLVFLLVVFVCAYNKGVSYIRNRVDKVFE